MYAYKLDSDFYQETSSKDNFEIAAQEQTNTSWSDKETVLLDAKFYIALYLYTMSFAQNLTFTSSALETPFPRENGFEVANFKQETFAQPSTAEKNKPKTITMAEALQLQEEIYNELKERKLKARQAEAKYWKFLDEEIEEIDEYSE